jgi:homospermidine synthase
MSSLIRGRQTRSSKTRPPDVAGERCRHVPADVSLRYRPFDDGLRSTDELAGLGWVAQSSNRILRDDIKQGMDEFGVLLTGNPRGVYWFGSRLTTDDARRLAPHNTATSLQVAAGILGGLVWALSNPRAGVVEPDDLDYEDVMRVARP